MIAVRDPSVADQKTNWIKSTGRALGNGSLDVTVYDRSDGWMVEHSLTHLDLPFILILGSEARRRVSNLFEDR